MTETTSRGKAVVTLQGETDLVISRVFDAPREVIWRVWTTPEHILRWWGGDRGVATVAEVDLRPGGAWRYVMRANAGFEVEFYGEYREVVPYERIVSTEVFAPMPDQPSLNTATFTEQDGRTTLTVLVQHARRETRDQHLASGMEAGMNESYDHLEQLAIALVSGTLDT